MAYKTIKIKKYSDHIEELIAVAAITPGMLVEYTSAGEVQKHSTAEGNAIPAFALEDEMQGKDIDDAYAADDPVQVWVPYRGDQVYAILADGHDVSKGDLLESDGNGYLQPHVADEGSSPILPLAIVGQSLEDVDTSDSATATSRIRIAIV